jgi:NADH:ubiquinone oxidoreductase subunit 2 (subunit N)
VGALLTVVALFYYLLIARSMYIDAPERRDPIPVAPLLSFCIFLCVLGVVLIGVFPRPLVGAALRAAAPLF